MNFRRILIVLAGIVILAGLVFGAWYLFRRASSSTETTGNLPEISGDIPVDATADASALVSSTISTDPVVAYRAYPDGSTVTVSPEGRVARIKDGAVVSLSEAPVSNFASASFSADGSRILVLTGVQPRSQVNVFEVSTASWRIVSGTFRDAAWAPRGSQLATLTPDPRTGKTSVAIYDAATGRTVQTLLSMAFGDVAVSWPAPGTIVVSDKPTARSVGSSWAIDIATKRISLLARGGKGFAAIWDDTAMKGISFESKPFGTGGTASIILNRTPAAKLSFTTLPEKCTFSSLPGAGSSTTPYVMCAIPRDQDGFQRSTLPDAWLRNAFYTDDVIVGVNLDTKTVDFTVVPPLAVDAVSLQVVGNDIYYLDRASKRVYRSAI